MTSASDHPVHAVLLRKRYGGQLGKSPEQALEHLDLEVAPGEAHMLVGPNGAGKSTALRLIAGIERPDSGTLKVFGESALSMSNRRRVGYLPDASELFPFLDVDETLNFFAAANDVPAKEKKTRIEELVDQFGMRGWRKKRTREYSLGMRRRLGLACVLIGKPDLLLLDEPTSGLDPAATRMFLEVCAEEKERGAALILSSHHLSQAESFCDHVVVLKKGRVAFRGPVNELAQEVGRQDFEIADLGPEAARELEDFLKGKGASIRQTRVAERGLEDFLLGDNE